MSKKCIRWFVWSLLLGAGTLSSQLQADSVESTSLVNVVFPGDYPDPSLLRDGQDYYLTHSSFESYPGLLIWHSTDLVNWEPISRALHKYVGSVWAPDLMKYKDLYYLYFPASGSNWVVTAPHLEGPWSEPKEIKIGQIDPGHVVDTDGNRYLHFSGGWVAPVAENGIEVQAEAVRCYEGWEIPTEWDVACKCLEGPKLFYREPYYYLTSAEGGTVGPPTAHMAISARAETPMGPWENSPYNPIVHTWSDDETWHAKGHGTVFEDAHHQWWIIFHGYRNGYYTLGRSTLMEPVEWTEDGWFREAKQARALNERVEGNLRDANVRMNLSDSFEGDELGIQWTFWKAYTPERLRFSENCLELLGVGKSPTDSPPLLCKPMHRSYEIEVNYELTGEAKGGLVLFYNESMYAGLVTDGEKLTVYRRGQRINEGENPIGRSGYLKIRNVEHKATFFYSEDGEVWQKIQRSFMTEGYNHTVMGGFLGLKTGLVSLGEGSVKFKGFKYSAIE